MPLPQVPICEDKKSNGYKTDRNLVHAFYTAALRAGGKCNGLPGPRPHYFRTYYAAFVLDPVGNNIEAVCLWPGWTHLGYWFGMGPAFAKEKEKHTAVEDSEERETERGQTTE